MNEKEPTNYINIKCQKAITAWRVVVSFVIKESGMQNSNQKTNSQSQAWYEKSLSSQRGQKLKATVLMAKKK